MRAIHWFFAVTGTLLALIVWTALPVATPRHVDIPAAEAQVRAWVANKLVMSDEAELTYDTIGRFLMGGIVICGSVTYPDSAGARSGTFRFYAVIQNGEVTEGAIEGNTFQDPTFAVARTMRIACKVRRNVLTDPTASP